jgi:hypothetical protein
LSDCAYKVPKLTCLTTGLSISTSSFFSRR